MNSETGLTKKQKVVYSSADKTDIFESSPASNVLFAEVGKGADSLFVMDGAYSKPLEVEPAITSKPTLHVVGSTGRAVCKFFISGYCSSGSTCPFAHPAQGDTQRKPLIPCQYFLRGSCREGSSCRFSHLQSGASTVQISTSTSSICKYVALKPLSNIFFLDTMEVFVDVRSEPLVLLNM